MMKLINYVTSYVPLKVLIQYFLLPAFASITGAIVGGFIVYLRTKPKPDVAIMGTYSSCSLNGRMQGRIECIFFVRLHNKGLKFATIHKVEVEIPIISYTRSKPKIIHLAAGQGYEHRFEFRVIIENGKELQLLKKQKEIIANLLIYVEEQGKPIAKEIRLKNNLYTEEE